MNRRPRFTSNFDRVRNAALGAMLRPLLWFSPAAQFGIGLTVLVILTSLLITSFPLGRQSLWSIGLVLFAYVLVWRFVEYYGSRHSLPISTRRTFGLVGSAIMVEIAMIKLGFVIATAFASGSRYPPLNDPSIWSFTIPFAAASLLVTMLIDRRLGLITGLFAAVLSGLIAPHPAQTILYGLASCLAAAYGVKRYRERQSVTLAGLVVAGVNAVTALAIAIAWQSQPIQGALLAAGCGVASGLLTIIFAAGGVPINESLFGILTDMRLLELSNADLPVLSQLALRAPGTNQHSHAVSQLAEDACRAIGANTLLTRIGSLYHDIGKVAAPDYFVENQSGHNPHDRLRPAQSAKIITSHVTYGLALAKEIGLPKQIADFIPQHHGTRTLYFFLRKAQQQANGEVVDENDFRYPGPKPQFKESAIMMLADSCEAAARTLAKPDPESIREIVKRIFEAIADDGQLDECDLTARQLDQMREAIVASLISIYHARIDYPGFNVPPPSATGDGRRTADEPRNSGYASASEVPINRAGEVEDEALPHWPEDA